MLGVVEMRLGLVGGSLGRAMVCCAYGLYSVLWAAVVRRGCNETLACLGAIEERDPGATATCRRELIRARCPRCGRAGMHWWWRDGVGSGGMRVEHSTVDP